MAQRLTEFKLSILIHSLSSPYIFLCTNLKKIHNNTRTSIILAPTQKQENERERTARADSSPFKPRMNQPIFRTYIFLSLVKEKKSQLPPAPSPQTQKYFAVAKK